MVLLVIDAQKEITNDRLYKFSEFVSAVKTLIKAARENGVEVIFVRHDDGAGTPMTKGADGFERGYKIIVPQYANTTFDNKFMSAENSYKYYNDFIWNGRYAECISAEDTILRMKGLQK